MIRKIELFERQKKNSEKIPVVVYAKDFNKLYSVNSEELTKILHTLKFKILSTVFELQDGKNTILSIIKDIQLHPITEEIVHIDFLKVSESQKITVPLPIKVINQEKAPFTKSKGILYLPSKTVKVVCDVKNIPEFVVCNVEFLDKGDVIKITDKKYIETDVEFATKNSTLVTILDR